MLKASQPLARGRAQRHPWTTPRPPIPIPQGSHKQRKTKPHNFPFTIAPQPPPFKRQPLARRLIAHPFWRPAKKIERQRKRTESPASFFNAPPPNHPASPKKTNATTTSPRHDSLEQKNQRPASADLRQPITRRRSHKHQAQPPPHLPLNHPRKPMTLSIGHRRNRDVFAQPVVSQVIKCGWQLLHLNP